MSRYLETKKRTRIQNARRESIFQAALEVFTQSGLRGATLEQISEVSGLSKQNIKYYFNNKDEIYSELLENHLNDWLNPLREISEDGDPVDEIMRYIRKKLQMSQELPLHSRLFATEILHGAPRMTETLKLELKELVDEKSMIIQRWIDSGKIEQIDPKHMFFSIWATTQHYADFDIQVRAVLGEDRVEQRFNDAENYLTKLFIRILKH